MNTKQRILGITLAEKLRRHPEYAKAIGVSVKDGLNRREGGNRNESARGDRCGDVQS